VIAHRSGNSLTGLRAAEALGLRAVEADLRLFRGRIEVRHLKTLGPIPLLWDRWELSNPFAQRLLLPELLEAVGPGTELVLDLKGRDGRLSRLVLEALRPLLGRAAVTVCARSWPLLEPFRGEGVRLVHSVGSARQLRRLRRRAAGARLEAVAVHERLVDARSAHELRALAEIVFAWPVNTLERARELVQHGVHGLITDRPEMLRSAALAGGAD
jgi:glycerophosphoryl diester phosphodiesterase